MDPELEALLKVWDAYQVQEEGAEAERLFAVYEARLTSIATARKLQTEILHRAVKKAFCRWQWADDPKFPRDLRKITLD